MCDTKGRDQAGRRGLCPQCETAPTLSSTDVTSGKSEVFTHPLQGALPLNCKRSRRAGVEFSIQQVSGVAATRCRAVHQRIAYLWPVIIHHARYCNQCYKRIRAAGILTTFCAASKHMCVCSSGASALSASPVVQTCQAQGDITSARSLTIMRMLQSQLMALKP